MILLSRPNTYYGKNYSTYIELLARMELNQNIIWVASNQKQYFELKEVIKTKQGLDKEVGCENRHE